MSMAYRLCLAIGCPHPDHLFEVLTGEQFDGWCAYFRRRPFGHDLDHQMLAQLALLIAASGGQSGARMEDYMPHVESADDDDIDDDELAAMFPGAAEYAAKIQQQNQPDPDSPWP